MYDDSNLYEYVVRATKPGERLTGSAGERPAGRRWRRVASTNCMINFPLPSTTATEIVSWWTSSPTYFHTVHRVLLSEMPWLLLTAQGAPFYNPCGFRVNFIATFGEQENRT